MNALVVIDVQTALFQKNTPVYREETLLANINALADAFHGRSLPVFFIHHANTSWLRADTPGWQLHSSLHMLPGDALLGKKVGNAFQEQAVVSALRARDVDSVVVAGLVTHGCVRASCEGALRTGYAVTLAADAHSSFNADAAELIAQWNEKLASLGVAVHGTAQIIAGL